MADRPTQYRQQLMHAGSRLTAIAIAIAVVFAVIIGVTGIVPAAQALQPDAATYQSANRAAQLLPNSFSNGAVTQADDDDSATQAVTLTIDSITPIVTATSGFNVQVTVANHSNSTVPAGTLSALTNLNHTFISRTDIQQWAEGGSNIPTITELGNVTVPAIADGSSVIATISVPSTDDVLAGLAAWGPRPLMLYYITQDGELSSSINTFFTRSWDGLSTTKTPELHVTMAMPLTSDDWSLNDTAVTKLLTGKSTSSTNPATAVALSDNTVTELKTKDQLSTTYPNLNIVVDPRVLPNVNTPHVAGVMQPGAFDITAYSQINNADLYTGAGISLDDWSAETAINTYRNVIGDDSAKSTAYAWQGNGVWTQSALTEARSQGYNVVIATHDFDTTDDATAHTATTIVPTDAGDVTVLSSQPVLSALAGGTSTATKATAESTTAGRVARFMAQSAFYQMEQPYTDRHLLVTLSADTSVADITALMTALQEADWLNLTDLKSLAETDPYATDDDAAAMVPIDTSDSNVNVTALTTALASLRTSRGDIARFIESVVVTSDEDSSSNSSGSGSGSGSGDGNDSSASPSQNSSSTDGSSNTAAKLSATDWGDLMKRAESAIAVLAMGGTLQRTEAMTGAATSFVNALMNSVSITSSNNVTVVSETASMPVTVSNDLPYPVRVKVSSITDSMEIVTSRYAETTVPANGEAQVTFTIRVSTSGTTTATERLLDQKGQTFGEAKTITITSTRQISDQSGLAFIVAAVVLGILGLWRQFHRKKDPDE